MCAGSFQKDPIFAASIRKTRYVRTKANYYLRGRYRRIGGQNCIYCGFKAETGDHVPCLFAGYTNGVTNGVIVPSCYSCNKHLGSFSSTCLRERAAFLVAVYEENKEFRDSKTNEIGASSQLLQQTATYNLKATRCRQRLTAVNCNLLDGSAELIAENGESGGEVTLYGRTERARFVLAELPDADSLKEEPKDLDNSNAARSARLRQFLANDEN